LGEVSTLDHRAKGGYSNQASVNRPNQLLSTLILQAILLNKIRKIQYL